MENIRMSNPPEMPTDVMRAAKRRSACAQHVIEARRPAEIDMYRHLVAEIDASTDADMAMCRYSRVLG